MGKGFGVFGLWILGAASLVAQAPALPDPAHATLEFQDPSNVTWQGPTVNPKGDSCADPSRFWVRGEYLLWWVKNTPLPVPLVTTGDPNVGFPALNTAGGIGQNGTQVLVGDSSRNFGAISGMRFTLGGWIDAERSVGIEGSGFLLERRSDTFAASSDANGNPPLYFPRFNTAAGFEDALPIADPLRGFSGNVIVGSTLDLWGAEGNAALNVWRRPGAEVTLLAGFRYAELRETLQIQNTTTDLIFNNVSTINDFFGTRNQFYGGQVGGRLALERDRLRVDLTGKVALGATHQVVDIQGNITQFGPNPLVPPGLGTSPGGFFAQPSNIGRYTANQFTVLPSAEVKVSYQILKSLRAFVGYDFIYWNQVVRTGNQVNHSVNVTQNAVLDPNGVGLLVGPAQPAPLFNRGDFWAQGVNFGLEFNF